MPAARTRRLWMYGVAGAALVVIAIVIGLLLLSRHPSPAGNEVADTGKTVSGGSPADFNSTSPPASLETHAPGQTRSAGPSKGRMDAAKEASGRKLAFLVGVKKYNHQDLKDLDFPERDVADLGTVLKGDGFQVMSLTTEAGTQDSALKPAAENIRRQLKELLKGATKHDLIVVGLAGHGLQPLGSDESYFCAMDSNPTQKDGKLLEPATLVGISEVLSLMSNSGIGDKMLLVDACRNDPQVRGSRRGGVVHVEISALPSRTAVLLSCDRGEFSFESKSYGGGHGAFFFQVIEGLKGAATDEDGEITWDSLQSFVRKRVPSSVQQVFGNDGGNQSPNAIGNLTGAPTVLAIATAGGRPKSSSQENQIPISNVPATQSVENATGKVEKKSAYSAEHRDYDPIATGQWIPLLPSTDEFEKLLAEKRCRGNPQPKFDGSLLELNGSPTSRQHVSWVGFPVGAKNVIVRAQVRKLSPGPERLVESHLGLHLRAGKDECCQAMLTGRNVFVIGRVHEGNWQSLATRTLAENYDDEFFEFAFSAIEDKLTVYVNGRNILEFADPKFANSSRGIARVAVLFAGGLFKDIEVQVLD